MHLAFVCSCLSSSHSLTRTLSHAKVIKLFTFENHKMIYEHKNPFVSIPLAFAIPCNRIYVYIWSKCGCFARASNAVAACAAPAAAAASATAAPQSHDKSSRTFFVIIYFSLLIVWMSRSQFVSGHTFFFLHSFALLLSSDKIIKMVRERQRHIHQNSFTYEQNTASLQIRIQII